MASDSLNLKSWLRILLGWLTFLAAPVLHAQSQPHIRPLLATESGMPAPGTATTLAIVMRTDRGWHGYWSNPGEAGLAPQA